MRIIDSFGGDHPVFSFEFFPPKTPSGEERLWAALSETQQLAPTFLSVTYGAGGSTRAATAAITRRVKEELGVETMSHLTCVGATRDELYEVLCELRDAGVENIMALRGDPPQGEARFQQVEGGFAHASELVAFIKQEFGFCVGAACYPEVHPEAPSAEADLAHLKAKVDAGADFLVTQLFFDNQRYFDFVDRARAAGITAPILPGIMPIGNVEQIKRFTKMCGASIPAKLMAALELRAAQPERVHNLGVVHAAIQSLGLLQGGAPGVHFYTLNRSTASREILSVLQDSARL